MVASAANIIISTTILLLLLLYLLSSFLLLHNTKKAKPETQQRETQPLEPKHLRYVPSKKSSAPNAALQISVR